MNLSDKYKWELIPYYNCSDSEKGGLSAKHLYGKFLSYTEHDDFVGASLAKKMLERGSRKNNEFASMYANASTNDNFLFLEDEFYNSINED